MTASAKIIHIRAAGTATRLDITRTVRSPADGLARDPEER